MIRQIQTRYGVFAVLADDADETDLDTDKTIGGKNDQKPEEKEEPKKEEPPKEEPEKKEEPAEKDKPEDKPKEDDGEDAAASADIGDMGGSDDGDSGADDPFGDGGDMGAGDGSDDTGTDDSGDDLSTDDTSSMDSGDSMGSTPAVDPTTAPRPDMAELKVDKVAEQSAQVAQIKEMGAGQ